jgi:hypothetical protein
VYLFGCVDVLSLKRRDSRSRQNRFPHFQENNMDLGKESHALQARLAAPLTRIVDDNKTRITALLASDGAAQVGQALNKDENVRRVATFCYPLFRACCGWW